jgi:uncharacterized delta-60 repeat protein
MSGATHGYLLLVRRVALLVLASLLVAVPAGASRGDLDPTFSGDGWVRTYEIFGYSKRFFPKGAEDVAIQPDRKILAVSELQDGNSHWWYGVYRWLPNGDLDRSFGSGGFVATDLGIFPMPHSVALQADGKILVGGQIECPGLQLCFGIVRYDPNGSLDGTFGASGVARATFPGSRCGCEIHDLAVQRNGRIVAVGWRFRGGDAQDDMLLAIARFLPDGRLDPSFSRDGRRSFDLATATISARRWRCNPTAGSSSAELPPTGTGPRTTSWCFGSGRTARSIARSPATASRA